MSGASFMALIARSGEVDVTWDPANKNASVTLSNSNYDAVGTATLQCLRATKGISGSQKGYFEVIIVTAVAAGDRIGTCNHSTYNNYITSTSQSGGFRPEATSFLTTGLTGNAVTDIGGTSTNNDVIMVAVDMGAGRMWIGRNNTWFNSGNPGAGTGHQYSGLTGTHYPAAGFVSSTEKYRIRGNTTNVTYAPPSGFTVLGAL